MEEEIEVFIGSSNVFADLGVENPEDELAKAQLAHHVRLLIREQGLTDARAAQMLGVEAAEVAGLMGGKVSGFSYDHLLKFLNALECNVKIIIEPRNSDHAHGRTLVAPA